MQLPYTNSLSISRYAKEIPYLGTGIPRIDGQINHGFKNLIAYPELIDAIPELTSDQALKSLISSLNTETSRFFTTGCFSREIQEGSGYRHHGYLEFSWNCQICIRDAITYFSLFFHFEHFLHIQQFDKTVTFQWSIEYTNFADVDIPGFCCAISINTDSCASSDRSYDTWQASLKILESFLNSVPGRSAQAIYSC